MLSTSFCFYDVTNIDYKKTNGRYTLEVGADTIEKALGSKHQ